MAFLSFEGKQFLDIRHASLDIEGIVVKYLAASAVLQTLVILMEFQENQNIPGQPRAIIITIHLEY